MLTSHSLFLVSHIAEYLSDLVEWGPIYTLWSNSEDQLVSALQSMSKAVDLCCNSLKELVSEM